MCLLAIPLSRHVQENVLDTVTLKAVRFNVITLSKAA